MQLPWNVLLVSHDYFKNDLKEMKEQIKNVPIYIAFVIVSSQLIPLYRKTEIKRLFISLSLFLIFIPVINTAIENQLC